MPNKVLQAIPVTGRVPTGDYNVIDARLSANENVARIEFWIARAIGTKLVKTYPNRQWSVNVDGPNEVMVIQCPSLSTRKGYVIRISGLSIPQLEEKAVRAAGEILERYGVTRGRNQDPNEFDHLPQTVRDEVIAPDAAPEPI